MSVSLRMARSGTDGAAAAVTDVIPGSLEASPASRRLVSTASLALAATTLLRTPPAAKFGVDEL